MRKATHPFHLPGNRRHGKAACITASGFRGCCSMSHIHRGVTSAFRYFSRITAARSLHLFISRHGRDATKADHAGDSHHIFISRLCARCNMIPRRQRVVSKGKGNWENGISFPKNRDFRARSRLEMSSYRRHSREKYQNFPGKYFSMSLYERHQGFGMEGLALFPSSFFLVHFL